MHTPMEWNKDLCVVLEKFQSEKQQQDKRQKIYEEEKSDKQQLKIKVWELRALLLLLLHLQNSKELFMARLAVH